MMDSIDAVSIEKHKCVRKLLASRCFFFIFLYFRNLAQRFPIENVPDIRINTNELCCTLIFVLKYFLFSDVERDVINFYNWNVHVFYFSL